MVPNSSERAVFGARTILAHSPGDAIAATSFYANFFYPSPCRSAGTLSGVGGLRPVEPTGRFHPEVVVINAETFSDSASPTVGN
jgi:hypothetical protein